MFKGKNVIGKTKSFNQPRTFCLITFTFSYSCLLHLRHPAHTYVKEEVEPLTSIKMCPHLASPTSFYHRRQRRPFRSTRPGSRAVMRTFRSPSSPRYRRRSPNRTTRSARWPRAAPEWKPRRVTARWSGRYPWRRFAVPPCAV